jgi:hypothetical protein
LGRGDDAIRGFFFFRGAVLVDDYEMRFATLSGLGWAGLGWVGLWAWTTVRGENICEQKSEFERI